MSTTHAERTPCQALKKNGQPCTARALASGFCIAHDERAAEWRIRGGKGTAKSMQALKRLPERLRPVADMLAEALQEVHAGTLKPQQATAMASVATALVRVVQSGELEERVKQLEAALEEVEREQQEAGYA